MLVIDETGGAVNPNEVESIAQCAISFYDISPRLLQNLTIVIIDDNKTPTWKTHDGRVIGTYTSNSNFIQVAYWGQSNEDGGWQDILTHELKHWIMEKTTGDADGDHSESIWEETYICIDVNAGDEK
jgi:hypothetical protein